MFPGCSLFLDAVPRALRALDPVDDSAVHHQPRDRRARQRADPLPVVQVSDGQIVDQLTLVLEKVPSEGS